MSMAGEPRSFSPVDEAPVKTKPVPRNATNAQLATGINSLHGCLEGARADIDLIKLALGVGGDTTRAEAAQMRPKVRAHWDLQTVFTAIGSVGGGLLLFKIVAAVAPVAWKALLSVN